eukprot:Colp12_sorted_trinity150504_noHs@22473
MPFLTVQETLLGSVKIRYETHGHGETKVLLVMGLGCTSEAWESQTEYFARYADQYTVCTFDNRGVGQSSVPTNLITIATLADDAAAILRHLGWTNVHLVGISMGGMIALEVMCRHRDLLASATLINTHAGGITSLPPVKGVISTGILGLFQHNGLRARVAIPLLYGKDTLNNERRKSELYLEFIEREKRVGQPRLWGLVAQVGAIATHYVSARRLRQVRDSGLPVMICVSSDDNLVRTVNSYRMQKDLGATMRVFKGTGHVLIDETHVFSQALTEHINKAKGEFEPAIVPLHEFEPLSGIDRYYYRNDRPKKPASIAAVLTMEGKVERESLLQTLNKWTFLYPKLRQNLYVTNGIFDRSYEWHTDYNFDITNHIHEHRASDEPTDVKVAKVISEPMLRRTPLWEVHHFPSNVEGGSSILIFRLHRCFGDASTLSSMLSAFVQKHASAAGGLGGPTQAGLGSGPVHSPRSAQQLAKDAVKAFPRAVGADATSRWGDADMWWVFWSLLLGLQMLLVFSLHSLGYLIKLFMMAARARNPFFKRGRKKKEAPTGLRETSMCDSVPLYDLFQLAHGAELTVNALILALVAGALRRCEQETTNTLRRSDVYALVALKPKTLVKGQLGHVTMPAKPATHLGNSSTFGMLHLPSHVASPIGRVKATVAAVDALTHSAEASWAYLVHSLAGRVALPKPLKRYLAHYTKRAAACVTVSQSLTGRLHLCGSGVKHFAIVDPSTPSNTIAINISAHAGQVCLGVTSPPNHPISAKAVTAAFAEEYAELREILA